MTKRQKKVKTVKFLSQIEALKVDDKIYYEGRWYTLFPNNL